MSLRDFVVFKVGKAIPDAVWIQIKHLQHRKKICNLKNPETFNDKLNWLKLHDHKPEYIVMADKIAMRGFVADRIGEGHTIPLIGEWDSPDDIDFNILPPKFVLKCNHNSGTGMYICSDKKNMNVEKVRSELWRGIKEDYFLTSREWPYKYITRKILCEEYMEDNSSGGALTDYKFFCFNGIPRIMYISHDGAQHPTTDFFDMDFNRLALQAKDPSTEGTIVRPECFDTMRDMAQKLSEGVPFLRVDFYYINRNIYVGELTFYHNAGTGSIRPESWEKQMGNWIDCSMVSKKDKDD